MILQQLSDVPDPNPSLEQYPTPADIGAHMIFQSFGSLDVQNKTVVEPGCGKGLLALGASLMGALEVTGFDVDPKAVDAAKKNLHLLQDKGFDVDVDFYVGSLPNFDPDRVWDTVIMNPPFGSQNSGADRPFLDFSSRKAQVVYSLHLHKTREFVVGYMKNRGFHARVLGYFIFPIRHTFSFHTREKKEFEVSLIRSERP